MEVEEKKLQEFAAEIETAKILKQLQEDRFNEGVKVFNETVKPILEKYGMHLTTNHKVDINGIPIVVVLKPIKNPE